jgi:uncharacterized membrane protein YidH (DUF202 family)
MSVIVFAQIWLADHGVGQYPEPEWRARRRQSHPLPMSARILGGLLCVFLIIVFGGVLLGMGVVAYAFLSALVG